VQLEVFNVLGQRIRTLVDARVRPGAHEVAWDGTDRAGRATASGIYIYRLSIGGGEDGASVGATPLVLSRRLLLLH
jgi:flagellar hook assembly protein FlgD